MMDKLIIYLNSNNIQFNSELDYYDLLEDQNLFYDSIDDTFYDREYETFCYGMEESFHTDNTFYCDYSNRDYNNRDYEKIRVQRTNNYLSSYCDYSDYDLVYCYEDDLLYDREQLYYHESDGKYHIEPEESEEYNANYHTTNVVDLSNGSRAKIGFEVEKEDEDIKESYPHKQVYNGYNWGKENDGSLDSDSGFELVSPIFDLHKHDFNAEFAKIQNLINANYSYKCGGHINYSDSDYYPLDLLDRISGYVPLLYALYEHRINKDYCKSKSVYKLKNDRVKYQAINIKSHCLEIRIFPAVKNVKNLLWRTELIKIIDLYKTDSVIKVIEYITDKNNPLHILLTKVFSYDQIIAKVHKVATYSQVYNQADYINPSVIKNLTDKLK
jgi:hypothetical protein